MDPIVLDLSRLISRASRPVPTGIDRVEMAYANHLLATARERLVFAAMTGVGRFGPLPFPLAERFVAAVQARWSGYEKGSLTGLAVQLQVHAALDGEAGLWRRLRTLGGTPRYLSVSHHHLDKPASIARLRNAGARFICLVHDLIPMELPEYAREGQAERHEKRMQTVVHLADGIIVNSRATGRALQPLLDQAGRRPTVIAAHIGFDPPARRAEGPPPTDPYFVYVATIEPRKNHLLLLKLWRTLTAEFGAATPKLVLIGQRGWNTGSIADMLDRSSSIRGFVEEHNRLADHEMEEKLIGARALLFPAFAEGFGLPLAEALARGVPAVCSDLAALREVGGETPEYLDPLDGPSWRSAIIDYSDANHERRLAQIERMSRWQAPTWAAHFEAVAPLLD